MTETEGAAPQRWMNKTELNSFS